MNAFAQAGRVFQQTLTARGGCSVAWHARVGALLQKFGPYAAIELLLPGGSLIALGLWLYRRYRAARAPGEAWPAPATVVVALPGGSAT